MNLFKNGFELFRSHDPVQGFTIDNTDKKHLIAIKTGKKDKIRKISMKHSHIQETQPRPRARRRRPGNLHRVQSPV